jgi:uncharacterized integral membrane protein
MQLLLIVGIIIAILAVVFALQNAIPITVSFLVWKFESSLALVLLIAIALGILMSLLVSVPSMIKRRGMISSQKKQLEKSLQRESEREKENESKNKESELPLE